MRKFPQDLPRKAPVASPDQSTAMPCRRPNTVCGPVGVCLKAPRRWLRTASRSLWTVTPVNAHSVPVRPHQRRGEGPRPPTPRSASLIREPRAIAQGDAGAEGPRFPVFVL